LAPGSRTSSETPTKYASREDFMNKKKGLRTR
jgi:hypothetical protein